MNVWHNAYSIFNNFPTITNRAQFRWFTEIFQYRCSKNGLEFAANFALTCIRCINCLSCRTEVILMFAYKLLCVFLLVHLFIFFPCSSVRCQLKAGALEHARLEVRFLMDSWCQYNQISFVHFWYFDLKNGWEKVLVFGPVVLYLRMSRFLLWSNTSKNKYELNLDSTMCGK